MSQNQQIPVKVAAANLTEAEVKIGCVLGDTSGGAYTLTLPTPGDGDDKLEVLVQCSSNSGANALTIATLGDELINGAATYVLTGANNGVRLKWVAARTEWVVAVPI